MIEKKKTCEQLCHKRNMQMFNTDIKKCMFQEASGETKPKLQGDITAYTPKLLNKKDR